MQSTLNRQQHVPPHSGPNLIGCPDCATIQELPPIRSGRLRCWQCRGILDQASGRPRGAALAFALTTLALLVPGNAMMLMQMSRDGFDAHTRLSTGIGVMWHQGYALAAVAVAVMGVILPFFRFGLLAASLSAVTLGVRGRWIGPTFRHAERLDMWAMPDVFLIGCAIGFSRFAPYANVTLGAGGWCFLGAALMAMMTRATLERRRVWRAIGGPPAAAGPGAFGCSECDLVVSPGQEGERCPRCGTRLWRRKPNSMTTALALTVAGLILYPVANIYPLSMLDWFGGSMQHTLMSSVQQLLGAGLYFLAACIFTTSIAIPFIKLAAMLWLYISVRRRSARRLVLKTRLYRIVEELGRWSTMDVFTVVVYAPLLQFGQLASVKVGIGLPALLAVVVLTMMASRAFDPRLLWDVERPA